MDFWFWNTAKGTVLADVLIRTLPRLASQKDVKQRLFAVSEHPLDELSEALDSGERVTASFQTEDGWYLVLEKAE